jgi:hypothetical protein
MGTSRGILGCMSEPTPAPLEPLFRDCSTDEEALEGALVPAPKPADIRYEDETPADAVTRVLVVVERADGSVKEYEAREPQQWRMNDPESISAQVIRTTGVSLASGGGFRGLQAGMPSLSLSFTANPRYNLHIRNKRKDESAASPIAAMTDRMLEL